MTIQEQVELKKDYIINEYIKGRSSTSISRELKVNSYYISKILNSNNVKLRNTNKMTTEEVDSLIPKMKAMFESGMSICQISKELGTDSVTTGRRLKKSGYDTSRDSTEREDKVFKHTEEIIELYESGLSSNEISKKYDCSSPSIWKILNKNDIKLRKTNKYLANYTYFEKIDSDEKAWLLGIIYADGHVKTNTQVWAIALIDEDLIKEISKRVEYTGPLYYYKSVDKFDGYSCKPLYELAISSPKMKADLIRLGCVPNKTFILKYPTIEQVPLELRNSFIRGYLDGDGSTGFSIGKHDQSPKFKVQFTGTKEVCEGIKNEIARTNICKNGAKIYKANNKNDKNTYYCFIGGEDCVNFLDWLYKDSTIHLHRKWVKYMQLKEYFQYRHLLVTPSGNKVGWKERQKLTA